MAYRALVIEDDGTVADVLRMKLEREGHEVTVAPNQHDAYHLLDDKPFDFALLDLRLPTHMGDMDPNAQVGFDVLGRIREQFAADELPVIIMTAYEETSQTAVRALRAGANDYITKPFDDCAVSLDDKLREIVSCIRQARAGNATTRSPKAHCIVFKAGRVEIDGSVLEGASADLIRILGKQTFMFSLDRTGAEDPRMPGKEIAAALGVEEPTVRRRVTRFRQWITAERKRHNLVQIGDQEIVWNGRDWKGYCLNRDTCDLRSE